MNKTSTIAELDWITMALTLALGLTGCFMVYAADYVTDDPRGMLDMATNSGKQIVFFGVAIVLAFLVMLIDNKWYRTFAFAPYIVSVFLLLLVLVIARAVKGDASWIDLGPFKLQPSEFGKVATCLALASYLGGYGVDVRNYNHSFRALGIVALPMSLVLLQGDLGSTLVYLSFLIVLYRAGAPAIWYILGGLIAFLSVFSLVFSTQWVVFFLLAGGVVLFMQNADVRFSWWFGFSVVSVASLVAMYYRFYYPVLALNALFLLGWGAMLWKKKTQFAVLMLTVVMLSSAYSASVSYIFYKVLEPHQQCRILTWLRPDLVKAPCSDYNLRESKKAISSGGFTGKGFLEGEGTKMDYVPEQSTDFIFCTVGEEQGFLGSVFFIALFGGLLLRILFLAERQRSDFSKYYAYGVAGVLFIHFLINVGMTIGVMPIIGIPLPFVSYGGSSLMSFTLMMAILIKLDANRFTVFR